MFLSIINYDNKRDRFLISDKSVELNIPILPDGFSLVIQNKYTKNIKCISNEEIFKIFEDNRFLHELIIFNNLFIGSPFELNKFINIKFKDKSSNYLKIFFNKFEFDKDDFGNFIIKLNELYKKDEFNEIVLNINQKIQSLENNILNLRKITKNEINQKIQNLENDIILIKTQISL